MSEREIQKPILLKFGALPFMRIWRNNTGAGYGYGVVKAALARVNSLDLLNNMQLVHYGMKGSPDIHGIMDGGRFVCIETKIPGKGLEPDQVAWRKMFEARGGLYILARSEDDVTQALQRAGHNL